MKNKSLRTFIIGLILLSSLVYAIPAPCSHEELLETSDYAIEGYVVGVECGEAYDSGECRPFPEDMKCSSLDNEGNLIIGPCPEYNFKPELVSECIATLNVTENLKGSYNVGDKVRISSLKVVQECEDGEHLTPGTPKRDFRLGSKVRYYNSASCQYWSFNEVEEPPVQEPDEPTEPGEPTPEPRGTEELITQEPSVRKIDWIYYLIPSGALVAASLVYWALKGRK